MKFWDKVIGNAMVALFVLLFFSLILIGAAVAYPHSTFLKEVVYWLSKPIH